MACGKIFLQKLDHKAKYLNFFRGRLILARSNLRTELDCIEYDVGRSGSVVRDDRVVAGSNPTEAAWKLLVISFPPLCQCLSEMTLKAVGPLSMPGEIKHPTPAVNVNL